MPQTKIFLISFIVLFSINCNTSWAVSIKSERMIFNEKIHTKALIVNNNTDIEQSYSILWTHYKMLPENGRLKYLAKAEKIKGINWGDDMIKIEPNEFILPPNSKKQITLSIIPNGKQIAGEYRSHLQVKTNVVKTTIKPFAVSASTGIITPVFIRYGDLTAKASIKNIKLNKENDLYSVSLTLTRAGNRSIYGNITVACITDDNQKIKITQINGIAIYTEVTERPVKFNFNIPEKLNTKCQALELSYISLPKDILFHGKIMTSNQVKLSNN